LIFRGSPVSVGIATAPAYLYKKEPIVIDYTQILPDQEEDELMIFSAALDLSIAQMTKLRAKAYERLGESAAEIIDAQIMIVSDPSLYTDVENEIRTGHIRAAVAVEHVIQRYIIAFSEIADEYLRERAADIKDVGMRILRNLLKLPPTGLGLLDLEVIVVAQDLSPSDTIMLDKSYIKGLATDVGGRTSHAAILARALEIPAVLGLKNITELVSHGETIILDGGAGLVLSNPTPKEIQEYSAKKEQEQTGRKALEELRFLPADTLDGHKVHIVANIGSPDDIEAVVHHGGEGVGLYRTEFLFMKSDHLPTEEEQFQAYKVVAKKMAGKPTIIRTIDIGGDKKLPCFKMPIELNPFLGWRAIRICLDEPAIFKEQLRAILRASVFGALLIMYPMISGISELRKANAILAEAKAELQAKGIPFDTNIKVGVMIEIPAAALTADCLIKEADFFSIGTNDLCQYALAVDRMNEKISDLYQPFHPGVLRLIKTVIDTAHANGKVTGMCGEMAGDPLAAALLLGLGLDEFSMSASLIPEVKKVIRTLSVKGAQEIAECAMGMETHEEIATYLKKVSNDLASSS